MERYKESGNRNQLSFHLMSYEDMIDVESPERAIDAVEMLISWAFPAEKKILPATTYYYFLLLMFISARHPNSLFT